MWCHRESCKESASSGLNRTLPNLARKPRILVCAPSNAATDELLQRIMDHGFKDFQVQSRQPRTPCINSPTRSLARSFTHSLIPSLIHSLTHSPTHPSTPSLTHVRAHKGCLGCRATRIAQTWCELGPKKRLCPSVPRMCGWTCSSNATWTWTAPPGSAGKSFICLAQLVVRFIHHMHRHLGQCYTQVSHNSDACNEAAGHTLPLGSH